jgi:hypothetical protein
VAHDKSTQSEGSADLSDLLSILPGTIASLKDAGMYEDWLHYVRIVSENAFPLKNIAHLLFLDVCRWYHCRNTVRMRYSPAIKQFWLLCYKIFHGKVLRFMSGFRHIEQVKDYNTSKCLCNPMDNTIICSVPDISVLSQSAAVQVSEIAPGMLTQMLDMITYDQMKTHTLCVDGKKINVSSSQVDGEVNLFGFEDKTTFQENREELMTEISMIREIDNLLMSFQRQNKVYISEIPGEQNSLKKNLVNS